MKKFKIYLGLMTAASLLVVVACGSRAKEPQWTKARKLAGKEQGLSHISGLVLDDKFAYVTIGGTVADQNEGTSGLRKVDLETGAVTRLDDGEKTPQSDYGGLAIDQNFIYWNAGGSILRISKTGGKPEAIASDHVGIGADIAVDDKRIYWANHGYYSPNSPTRPSPVYSVSKLGGTVEIFADQQHVPSSVVLDEENVYWVTPSSILRQAKSGGASQVIYQASDKEGVNQLAQDGGDLYFGFRGAGESRWALRKVSKQGGEPQTVVKRYSLKPIVMDEANIYFFDEEGMSKDVLCRIAKTGGEVTKLDFGYASGVIAQSKSTIYFATLFDLYGLQK